MTQIESLAAFNKATQRKSVWLVGAVALTVGAVCGLIYGRRIEATSQPNMASTNEIIVSKDRGLVFKSEDGTPLLKIGQDSWGTHLSLMGSNGTPILQLNNLHDRGGIVLGSKAGSFAYIQAQEDSATITLIGKYNKEAVEISSASQDGGGNVSINEGKQGYHAVEISGRANRMKSKGVITIPNENGTQWQAP
jgi:hypothetical protein